LRVALRSQARNVATACSVRLPSACERGPRAHPRPPLAVVDRGALCKPGQGVVAAKILMPPVESIK
jgi:hypothetical protein